jgi:hypothetical protein
MAEATTVGNSDVVGTLSQEQQDTVQTPDQRWSDEYAAKIALADFQKMENYRNMNHDWRFRNADELYAAWTGTKYWDGTRVPRSSLGIYVCFEQIESLLPNIVKAIFASYPPFDTTPEPGTSLVESQQVENLLLHQLERIGNGMGNSQIRVGVRETVRRTLKSAFIYGNGITELGWESYERQRQQFMVQRTPISRTFNHPQMGPVKTVVGSKSRTVIKNVTETVNMPFAKNIPIQDFYIDQNCQSPFVQDARCAAVRELVHIDELLKYEDNKNFKLPSKSELYEWSKQKWSTAGDYSKSATELMRSGTYWPTTEGTADAAGQRVEVIRYVTPYRLVWLCGRKRAILNIPNPYGFINFFNMCYVDFPNRFYGFGVTDVAEGEQRLITSIINARVDELALAIHKPIIKRKGATFSQSQLRIRPGINWEVENPKEDIQTFEYGAINQNAYIEVEAAERRLQKYTGITDLAVQGGPTPGGNSANRTATGVNVQAGASGTRMEYLVGTAESTYLEPMLYGLQYLNQKFLDPQQVLEILGPDGKALQLDPTAIKNAECRFKFMASERMQSRTATLNALPLLGQSLLNPAFGAELAKNNNLKINYQFIGDRIGDALNWRSADIFQPMTPQEIQAMNAPPPGDVLKEKMQTERLDAHHQTAQEKGAADLLKNLLMHSAEHASTEDEEDKPTIQ